MKINVILLFKTTENKTNYESHHIITIKLMKEYRGQYSGFVIFCWIILFVLFSCRIRQCFFSSSIRFLHMYIRHFFINNQFRTCTNAFPNKFTVRSYEYCTCQHWILYWMRRISFVLGYLRTLYDIMKNFNCN